MVFSLKFIILLCIIYIGLSKNLGSNAAKNDIFNVSYAHRLRLCLRITWLKK